MSEPTETTVNSPVPEAPQEADRVETPDTAPPASTEAVPAVEETTPAAPAADADVVEVVSPKDPAPEGEADQAAPAPEAAAPARPAAGPRPTPRPRPGRPRPTPGARPVAEPEPSPVVDEAAERAAAQFGRVDEDGTVHVRESTGERAVGQFPGVGPQEALSLYVRRYLDLNAKVTLFETRLTGSDLSVKEIDSTLARLTEETTEPSAVGDLDALRSRVQALQELAATRRAELERERAAAKKVALEERTRIIEAAEKIAATDPSKIQWRPAGEELRHLLEQWKTAQRNGPRIDRTSEETLWKRFSHARTAFDRERRHFFADLEQRNSSAKAAKEQLVAEAEALSSSTDWGQTAGAYRDLMTRWKAAGRAARRDDDALWARFRGAQDAFFAARDEVNAATDAEYSANLVVKEQLLTEAEALLPVTDLAAAKSALRSIQERWEDAGKVPRADVQRVEGRLRAVETTVRDAEQAQWKRTNPETRARAEGAASQLEAAIAELEEKLAAARSAGNAREAGELETALAARRAWLEQVLRAAEDSRG